MTIVEPYEIDDVGDQVLPMSLNGNVSIKLSNRTELTTFELPLINKMRGLMDSSNRQAYENLAITCELRLLVNSRVYCSGIVI